MRNKEDETEVWEWVWELWSWIPVSIVSLSSSCFSSSGAPDNPPTIEGSWAMLEGQQGPIHESRCLQRHRPQICGCHFCWISSIRRRRRRRTLAKGAILPGYLLLVVVLVPVPLTDASTDIKKGIHMPSHKSPVLDRTVPYCIVSV